MTPHEKSASDMRTAITLTVALLMQPFCKGAMQQTATDAGLWQPVEIRRFLTHPPDGECWAVFVVRDVGRQAYERLIHWHGHASFPGNTMLNCFVSEAIVPSVEQILAHPERDIWP